jgi:hypothetical protein
MYRTKTVRYGTPDHFDRLGQRPELVKGIIFIKEISSLEELR